MRQNRVLPLLLTVFAFSCKASKSSQAVHVPGEDASIEDYEHMLDQSEGALAEIGIDASRAAATSAAGDAAGADDAAAPMAAEEADSSSKKNGSGFNGDCKTLCDLSSTTCELEARICVLAARHEGDDRYQNACSRAGNDCELAEGIAESSCECEY